MSKISSKIFEEDSKDSRQKGVPYEQSTTIAQSLERGTVRI